MGSVYEGYVHEDEQQTIAVTEQAKVKVDAYITSDDDKLLTPTPALVLNKQNSEDPYSRDAIARKRNNLKLFQKRLNYLVKGRVTLKPCTDLVSDID